MIFISYRKADTQQVVDQLARELKRHFGDECVFKDDHDIRAGENWPERLRREVLRSDVLLAVVGDRWLTTLDEDGRRRIDDKEDWVRREVVTALEARKTVIVLLVGGAKMPTKRGLPSGCSLQQLPDRQALPLRSGPDYETDLARLLAELSRYTPARLAANDPPVSLPAGPDREKSTGRGRRRTVVGVAASLLALLACSLCGGLAYFAWTRLGPDTKNLPAGGSLRDGELVEVEIAAGVKMKFCWVPSGPATLGSPPAEAGRQNDEQEHAYTSWGFWLAKYPVTQEQWQAVMRNNPSYFTPAQSDIKKAKITDTSRFPVESVTWNDCQEFLRTMNAGTKVPAAMGRGKFVLPHEDEWEYAARGGKGNERAFYWGNRLNGDKANCDGNYPYRTDVKGDCKNRTTGVGEYEIVAPHPWGLCDMSGNVWQWCESKLKTDGNGRALRGGSWNFYATYCRSASRYWNDPGSRNDVGFRPCYRPD